ncbi:hypothetical protein LIER_23116 [Lithospermum erythrorhizon]|uniref:Uncharacterized protein n=1 Tax=Lithospermum erythrorhizon TaxID=34254 RepID=A0AAV3QWH6_LITER
MDSPQSVVSPFKGSVGFEKQNSHHFVENDGSLSGGNGIQRNEAPLSYLEDFVGVFDVFFLPRPLMAVDSPFLNDALQLHVRNVETSLKCEIWMLSSVKNYLEDQLLGFALVPLSEGLTSNRNGPFPEVFVITAPAASVGMDTLVPNAGPKALVPTEFDKIELSD